MTINTAMALFPSIVAGLRLEDGSDLLNLINMLYNPNTGVVALAGGGQTGATQLKTGFNFVKTVASGSDSLALPFAVPGMWAVVTNKGGNDAQVFGVKQNPANANASDVVRSSSSDAAAAATGVVLADTKSALYYCYTLGTWDEIILTA